MDFEALLSFWEADLMSSNEVICFLRSNTRLVHQHYDMKVTVTDHELANDAEYQTSSWPFRPEENGQQVLY